MIITHKEEVETIMRDLGIEEDDEIVNVPLIFRSYVTL